MEQLTVHFYTLDREATTIYMINLQQLLDEYDVLCRP